MIRLILIILMMFSSLYAPDKKIMPRDLHRSTKDLIADTAKAVASDTADVLRSDMIDSAKVVTGDTAIVLRSEMLGAGITWTARSAAEANQWYSVIYSNGLFVAVSIDSTNSVMTSPDGINWTTRLAAETNQWEDITYGNGLFVVISSNGTNRVMTSPDGINWTARSAAEVNNWLSITYGNGLFVAVSIDGTNRVMTSPDGINWTTRSAAEANSWLSITYDNGLFVAVSISGINRVMTSPDGINWTTRSATEANEWRSIIYGNGLFVAVSANGTNRVMTSPDGINWTARSAAEANQWYGITYGNGLFVAVAFNGINRVMTSPDGINWTARSAAEANQWYSVTYGNGLFVAISTDGTNRVMTSGKQEEIIQRSEVMMLRNALIDTSGIAEGKILKYNATSDNWEVADVGGSAYADSITHDGKRVTGDSLITDAEGDTRFQPLESTLTDIADGTITENLVNTANPWADNEVANNLTIDEASDVDTVGIKIAAALAARVEPSEVPGLETDAGHDNFSEIAGSVAAGQYAAGSIDEPDLDATNSPTDNYILSYNAAGTDFTWVAPSGGGDFFAADFDDSLAVQSAGGDLTGTYPNPSLGTDVVDEAHIADNGIDSEHYNDGSIDHEHLAADVISGMTDATSTDADYMLFWDNTDSQLKKVDMGEVRGSADSTFDKTITDTTETDVLAAKTENIIKLAPDDTLDIGGSGGIKGIGDFTGADSIDARIIHQDSAVIDDILTMGSANITPTEMGYLDGTTSDIQTQIDNIPEDTLTYNWGIVDTVITGALPGWKVPYDITLVEIASYTDANTTTFNLEERAETTPNTAGTDALAADQVADNNQQEATSFSNAGFAKDTWAVPTISATGNVAIFSISVRYIKQ